MTSSDLNTDLFFCSCWNQAEFSSCEWSWGHDKVRKGNWIIQNLEVAATIFFRPSNGGLKKIKWFSSACSLESTAPKSCEISEITYKIWLKPRLNPKARENCGEMLQKYSVRSSLYIQWSSIKFWSPNFCQVTEIREFPWRAIHSGLPACCKDASARILQCYKKEIFYKITLCSGNAKSLNLALFCNSGFFWLRVAEVPFFYKSSSRPGLRSHFLLCLSNDKDEQLQKMLTNPSWFALLHSC